MENYLKRILEAALRSPSGDNCQPFRFKILNSTTIEIHHNPEAARHFFNSQNYASLITLGTLIESLIIEARGLGFESSIHLTADVSSVENHHWATFKLNEASTSIVDTLVGVFDQRWTCRYPFSKEKISDDIVQECNRQILLTKSEVKLHYEKPVTDEFINFLLKADLVLWKHKDAALDLLHKLRFSRSDSPYGDGMSGFELGINDFEMFFMRFLQSHSAFIPLFYNLGLKFTAQRISKTNYLNSGGLFAFSVPLDRDPKLASIEAGRSAMRVWLYLNKLGYVVQPITTASTLCFQNRNQTITPLMNPEYKDIFANGTQLWKKYFGVAENADVIWAFRVGSPLTHLQQHRSKRLKLEDIVIKNIEN